MKHLTALTPLACLAVALPLVLGSGPLPLTAAAGRGAPAEDGWTSLFDGKSLDGWRGYKTADATGTRWRVENGMLTLPPREGKETRSRDIITAGTFDRFELTWEWRVSPGGNSGVKYYVVEDRDSAIGHEYQVIDDARHADA